LSGSHLVGAHPPCSRKGPLLPACGLKRPWRVKREATISLFCGPWGTLPNFSVPNPPNVSPSNSNSDGTKAVPSRGPRGRPSVERGAVSGPVIGTRGPALRSSAHLKKRKRGEGVCNLFEQSSDLSLTNATVSCRLNWITAGDQTDHRSRSLAYSPSFL